MLLLFFNSIAQEPFYLKIGQEDLKGIDIYSITEDTIGQIILSTDNGIYKYDGYTFANTLPKIGFSKSLFGLTKDNYNTIYCYDLSRHIYKYVNDSLELYYTLPDSLSAGYLTISFDLNNDLILRKRDYYALTPKKELKLILKSSLFAGEKMYNRNGIFLCQTQTKSIFLLKRGKVTSFSKNLEIPLEKGPRIHLVPTKDGLFLGINNFAQIFKIDTNNFKTIKNRPSNSADQLNRPCRLNDSLFIIVKKKGESSILNIKTGQQLNKEPVFKGYYISSTYEDANGGIWLGTLKKGFLYIPNINALTYDNVIKDKMISAIEHNKYNKLFIGTLNGEVYQIDTSFHLTPFITYKNYKDIHCIKDIPQHNKLYIGSDVFDYSSRLISTAPQHINAKHVTKLSENLFGFSSGKKYYLNALSNDSISNHTIAQQLFFTGHQLLSNMHNWSRFVIGYTRYSFYDTLHNTLYIPNEMGLTKIKNNVVTDLKFNNQSIQVTESINVEDGILLSTINQGILLLKNNILSQYINKNIINGPIHGIKKNEENIYISSNDKLLIFSEKEKKLYQIDVTGGLKSNKIIDFTFTKSHLWLISTQTVQSINLNKIKTKFCPFKCYLKRVNGVLNVKNQKFPYQENNFVFTLTSNAVAFGKDIRYQYQLIGFDHESKTTQPNENRLKYNNLLPGDYTLKFCALKIDGTTSNQIVYSFHISPPFWNSWWFYTLIAIFVLSLISGFFILRIQLIKRKLILENRIKASEIRTIKAQMNPHFIFNSLNSIQDLIILQDVRKTNYYLSTFADLMRNVLAVSGKDSISVEQEIDILNTYLTLEKLRFEDDLHAIIDCQLSQIEKETIEIPSLLLQPYIENAFKHGLMHKKGVKTLNIKFYCIDDAYLICEIIDNGIGIKASREIMKRRQKTHQSFATSANQKRIDLINELNQKNKKINIEVSNAQKRDLNPGTKLVLKFPI